jgi:hypothetical protein
MLIPQFNSLLQVMGSNLEGDRNTFDDGHNYWL